MDAFNKYGHGGGQLVTKTDITKQAPRADTEVPLPEPSEDLVNESDIVEKAPRADAEVPLPEPSEDLGNAPVVIEEEPLHVPAIIDEEAISSRTRSRVGPV